MTKCIVCESLTDKLHFARYKVDFELEKIAYSQMREHLSRVKYPIKHGFK